MPLRSLGLSLLASIIVLTAGLAFAKSRPAAAPVGTSSRAGTLASGTTARIKITNYAYQPATLTVKIGTKITVTNVDQTQHTLTARSGAFDTGTVQPGASATFVVTKPGVYAYYCQFHAFMGGTLKVVK
jgi:plastocyanin